MAKPALQSLKIKKNFKKMLNLGSRIWTNATWQPKPMVTTKQQVSSGHWSGPSQSSIKDTCSNSRTQEIKEQQSVSDFSSQEKSANMANAPTGTPIIIFFTFSTYRSLMISVDKYKSRCMEHLTVKVTRRHDSTKHFVLLECGERYS